MKAVTFSAIAFMLAMPVASQPTNTIPFDTIENSCGIVYLRDRKRDKGLGSGFFVGTNGLFLTNYHVIQGAHSGYIKLRDSSKHQIVSVLNYSAPADLALLKINHTPSNILHIASPETTSIGMKIGVIGAPHGLGWVRTEGTVEGFLELNRVEAMQHTAKTAPGNSGSPIFDESGQVHGIHTWAYAREVRDQSGQFTLDWTNPQARGVYCRIIRKFLDAPRKELSLSQIAQAYENAENADLLLYACQVTDTVLRDLHAAITTLEKQHVQIVDSKVRGLDGRPKVLGDKVYLANVNHFVDEAGRFLYLKKFLFDNMPVPSSTDHGLQEAVNRWNDCHSRLASSIDKIVKAHGSSPASFNEAIESVKHQFIMANDSFFIALKNSIDGYKRYRFATLNDPLFDKDAIMELHKFYYNRGLTFKRQ